MVNVVNMVNIVNMANIVNEFLLCSLGPKVGKVMVCEIGVSQFFGRLEVRMRMRGAARQAGANI